MRAPYPNVTMLIDALRAVTPPELAYLIDDLFEAIVLYENRAIQATRQQARRRPLRGDADGQRRQGARRRAGRRERSRR